VVQCCKPMRTTETSKGLTVNTIAGTHGIVLGLDLIKCSSTLPECRLGTRIVNLAVILCERQLGEGKLLPNRVDASEEHDQAADRGAP
jgi:hypothetical protein